MYLFYCERERAIRGLRSQLVPDMQRWHSSQNISLFVDVRRLDIRCPSSSWSRVAFFPYLYANIPLGLKELSAANQMPAFLSHIHKPLCFEVCSFSLLLSLGNNRLYRHPSRSVWLWGLSLPKDTVIILSLSQPVWWKAWLFHISEFFQMSQTLMTLRHKLQSWGYRKTFVSFASTCALLRHMIPALNPPVASYIIGPEQANLCQVAPNLELL